MKLAYAFFFILGILVSTVVFIQFSHYFSGTVNPPLELSSQSAVLDSGKTFPIVAVNSQQTQGLVGSVTIREIPGTGNVLVHTYPYLEPDLQYSANMAIDAAKKMAGASDQFDYVVNYQIPSTIVGGQSAGAATALTALALFEDKNLNPTVAMTGTIDENGNIGEIGGVYEKAKAVADAGYKVFLIPEGQSIITSYEAVNGYSRSGFWIHRTQRYVPVSIDLKEEAKKWGLDVVEVSSLSDAAKYAFSS
jgi:uncharacterized protein